MATFDGSSLAGWTLSSPSDVFVDTADGQPAPSIRVAPAGLAHIDVPDTLIGVTVITFDVKIPASGAPLANFFVFCDAAGAGTNIRLDTRSFGSGVMYMTSWDSFGFVNVPFTAQQIAPVSVWQRYRLYTRSVAGQAQLRVFLVDTATLAETMCLDWTNFTVKGTCIGLVGGGSVVSGAWYDNVRVEAPGEATGKAVLSNGQAASQVVAYDWITNLKVDETVPTSDGGYRLRLPEGKFLIVAKGPDGFRPMAHVVTV